MRSNCFLKKFGPTGREGFPHQDQFVPIRRQYRSLQTERVALEAQLVRGLFSATDAADRLETRRREIESRQAEAVTEFLLPFFLTNIGMQLKLDALLNRSTIILAFSLAAATLLGAVAAWAGACAGGRHRDGGPLPEWMEHANRFERRRIVVQ